MTRSNSLERARELRIDWRNYCFAFTLSPDEKQAIEVLDTKLAAAFEADAKRIEELEKGLFVAATKLGMENSLERMRAHISDEFTELQADRDKWKKAYDECQVIIRNLHPQYGAGMRTLESRLTAAESKLKMAREQLAIIQDVDKRYTYMELRLMAKDLLRALDSEAAAAAGVEK